MAYGATVEAAAESLTIPLAIALNVIGSVKCVVSLVFFQTTQRFERSICFYISASIKPSHSLIRAFEARKIFYHLRFHRTCGCSGCDVT